MTPQKIIHILYSGLGGTTEYVFNLIKGDVDKVFNHEIIFYGTETLNEDVHLYASTISSKVAFIKKRAGYDKPAVRQLNAMLAKKSSATIIVHVNSLIFSIKKNRTENSKLIFIEHQANHLKTNREWLWSVIAQRKADAIISFNSEYQNGLRNKLGLAYKSKKNEIINTGVPLQDYRGNITKTDGIIRFGIISRINKFRDHKTLFSAFLELDPQKYELHIAGDGDLKEKLQSEYSGSNMIWHGHVNREKIIEILNKIDVYVIASFGESTSIALMQAQASGLPIIGSNVKGVNDVLNTENAILVEPKNVKDMKNALVHLGESEILRSKFASASATYANMYLDHQKMFQSFLKVLS